MPLIFIHGVNTRNTDEDYQRSVSARKELFKKFVCSRIQKQGFHAFAMKEDIYWGDLGVTFGWDLQSIPTPETLGPGNMQVANTSLLKILTDVAPVQTDMSETLGPGDSGPIANAAEEDPSGLVRAIFSGESERFAPTKPPGQGTPLSADQQQRAQE